MTPIRSGDIRESNERLILKLIHDGEGVSQSDVVVRTGLRAPTVLRFFRHLENSGYIRRVPREPEPEKRGRRPVYFKTAARAAYALGMEFWARSASAVILDFSGKVVFSRTWIPEAGDRDAVLGLLRRMFTESLRASGIPPRRLLGVCVGAPGQVNVETGEIIRYSRLGIADINLKTALEKELGLRVLVHNNSSAVAWDAFQRGAGKYVRSLFMVMIRAGVGGAFLDNGDIFVTRTRGTLEIGHIAVEYEGRPCTCGSRGCLETYLSEGAILSDLGKAANLTGITDLDPLLAEGRSDVQRLMHRKADILAHTVHNLISLFGPEMFLLVTRSPALGRFLAEGVRAGVKARARRRPGRTVIESALYDPENAGRGAADLVFRDFFAP